MVELDGALNELVIANRILANEDVVDAYGNVSIRHPGNPERFFMACMRPVTNPTRNKPGARGITGQAAPVAATCLENPQRRIQKSGRKSEAEILTSGEPAHAALKSGSVLRQLWKALRGSAKSSMKTRLILATMNRWAHSHG
jgi:hypothetical protein